MVFKVKDHYFNKAKQENYLARSVYKLEEIQKKYAIIKKGDKVIDFGYYPGSWIQYSSKIVGNSGMVVGIDIQDVHESIKAMVNVRVFCMDIFNLTSIEDVESKEQFNVVCSDMAPSTTGIKSLDQDRSLNLVESVFHLLPIFLKEGGNLVIKVFESGKAQDFLKAQKKSFKEFHYLRPKSTRSVSKEFFVIGKSYIHSKREGTNGQV